MPEVETEREVPAIRTIDRRLARASASWELEEDTSIGTSDDKTTGEDSPSWKLVSADIKHLSALLAQLLALRDGPEEDEYGVLRPAEEAFNQAFSLLVDTAIVTALRGSIVPYGCASTDSQGGVRVEWIGDKCGVHLVIPASSQEKSYIYHEMEDEYGTSRSVTAEVLADWLCEFQSAEKG